MYVYGEVVQNKQKKEGIYEYVNGKFKRRKGKRHLKIKPRKLKPAEQENAQDYEAIIRLEKDLRGFYYLDAKKSQDPIKNIISQGEMDMKKVYFQGNPLILCFRFQDFAYKTMEYTNYRNTKDWDKFFKLVKTSYLGLRERLYQKDEIREIRVLLGELKPRNKTEEKLAKYGRQVMLFEKI